MVSGPGHRLRLAESGVWARVKSFPPPATMRTQSPDTSPEAERVLIELLRATPVEEKLRLVSKASRSVRQLAMLGLKQRHPLDPPELLHRRLATLLLGETLADLAYGTQSTSSSKGKK